MPIIGVNYLTKEYVNGYQLGNIYVGSTLIQRSTYMSASGGTITTDGDYKIHTFTSSGSFIVTTPGEATILAVAGGGGGSDANKGGGGAGGVLYGFINFPTQSYSITIGNGGSTNSNGENSVISGSNFLITAIGGGTGASNGGSGGGATTISTATGSATQTSPYPQLTAYGNNGGLQADNQEAGGGGGAGAVGGNADGVSNKGGNGGNGIQLSISGTPTYYAGGGGGGDSRNSVDVSIGGLGGGGNGATDTTCCTSGTANTGGGGGGQGIISCGTGEGGSGIVIIRYQFQ